MKLKEINPSLPPQDQVIFRVYSAWAYYKYATYILNSLLCGCQCFIKLEMQMS